MGATIAAVAANLNRHQAQFNPKIAQQYRDMVQLEKYLRPQSCLHTYVSPTATASDFTQAYQPGFTPKGDVEFGEVSSTLQRMKLDIQFTAEQMDAFFDRYMSEWIETGKSMLEWTFPKSIYEEIIMPKIREEWVLIAGQGVRQDPTIGTPGVTINSCDGLLTNIDADITDGNITPIVTIASTAASQEERVRGFVRSLPNAVRSRAGYILTSPQVADEFFDNSRDLYGRGTGNGSDDETLRIANTNKHLVGIPEFAGTNRLLFVEKAQSNFVLGNRIGKPLMPVIRWQEFERTLKGLAEFERFYSYDHYEKVFISSN